MSCYHIESALTNLTTANSAFKEWLILVENEQANRGILKNITIYRQWLCYLWDNGYGPLDALKDVLDSKVDINSRV